MSLYVISTFRLVTILPVKSGIIVSELKELIAELDFEQWLDTEGIVYRRGGVSARGREVNIKECPVCGSSNWKVYFNLTSGVGKCFAG
ncbi:DNA primase, partial [Escherichia coli]